MVLDSIYNKDIMNKPKIGVDLNVNIETEVCKMFLILHIYTKYNKRHNGYV